MKQLKILALAGILWAGACSAKKSSTGGGNVNYDSRFLAKFTGYSYLTAAGGVSAPIAEGGRAFLGHTFVSAQNPNEATYTDGANTNTASFSTAGTLNFRGTEYTLSTATLEDQFLAKFAGRTEMFDPLGRRTAIEDDGRTIEATAASYEFVSAQSTAEATYRLIGSGSIYKVSFPSSDRLTINGGNGAADVEYTFTRPDLPTGFETQFLANFGTYTKLTANARPDIPITQGGRKLGDYTFFSAQSATTATYTYDVGGGILFDAEVSFEPNNRVTIATTVYLLAN